MSSTQFRSRIALSILLVGLFASVPAWAGSAVVGSVAGSLNATVGGQALLPNAVIFSGDSIQVKDGAAVVAVNDGGRMAFGRDTVASFVKEAGGLTVLLDQGNVSVYHPEGAAGMAVKVGEVVISPASGYKTLGDVAMVNGLVVVTAKEGKLRVSGNGPAVEVAAGKTITVVPRAARGAAQAGGTQKLAGGGSTALEAGALGAGAVAAILAGVAMSRAGNARDAANAANATASSAVSAANAAASNAAVAASNAAAAGAAANAAGCAVNNIGADTGSTGSTAGVPSPYVPPTGFTCPPNPSGKS